MYEFLTNVFKNEINSGKIIWSESSPFFICGRQAYYIRKDFFISVENKITLIEYLHLDYCFIFVKIKCITVMIG